MTFEGEPAQTIDEAVDHVLDDHNGHQLGPDDLVVAVSKHLSVAGYQEWEQAAFAAASDLGSPNGDGDPTDAGSPGAPLPSNPLREVGGGSP